MSYVKATEVLPEEILNLIQKYIEGEYIYIPKKKCNRKAWGETTKSKKKTTDRNSQIYKKYQAGVSTKVLSEMYYLSPKSIQKIISKIKKKSNKEMRHKRNAQWRIFISEKCCRLIG